MTRKYFVAYVIESDRGTRHYNTIMEWGYSLETNTDVLGIQEAIRGTFHSDDDPYRSRLVIIAITPLSERATPAAQKLPPYP